MVEVPDVRAIMHGTALSCDDFADIGGFGAECRASEEAEDFRSMIPGMGASLFSFKSTPRLLFLLSSHHADFQH